MHQSLIGKMLTEDHTFLVAQKIEPKMMLNKPDSITLLIASTDVDERATHNTDQYNEDAVSLFEEYSWFQTSLCHE